MKALSRLKKNGEKILEDLNIKGPVMKGKGKTRHYTDASLMFLWGSS